MLIAWIQLPLLIVSLDMISGECCTCSGLCSYMYTLIGLPDEDILAKFLRHDPQKVLAMVPFISITIGIF
jgi:hypothetical protein